MKILLTFLVILSLVSCSSKKHLTTDYSYSETKNQIEEIDNKESLTKTTVEIKDSIFEDSEVLEVKETTFEIVKDSVSGQVTSVPIKEKTTTKTKIKTTIKKDTKEEVLTSDIEEKVNKETQEDKEGTLEKVQKKEFKNTAIIRGLYLIVILIVGGYIVIKMYFPSIFVKVKNLLTL